MRRRVEQGETSQALQSDGSGPLDSDEQAAVIQSIVEQSKCQDRVARRVLAFLFTTWGMVILYCFVQLLRAPWVLHHQKALEELQLPGWAFHLSYAVALGSLILSWQVAQGKRSYLTPGLMLGCANLVTWAGIFYLGGVTDVLLCWLPGGPLVALGLGIFVAAEAEGLRRDIQGIDKLRYNFKKL